MSVAHDRKFLDRFSLAIGIFVGVSVALVVLAVTLGRRERPERLLAEPEYRRQVEARLAPLVRVAVAGRDNAALSIVPDSGAKQPQAAAAIPTTGTGVYEQVCVACHAQGIGGAPRFGDAAAWNPRVAKGKATLYTHAIEGFKGEAGIMPPKGGRVDLADDLIRAAVDHMVQSSR